MFTSIKFVCFALSWLAILTLLIQVELHSDETVKQVSQNRMHNAPTFIGRCMTNIHQHFITKTSISWTT